jgi:hypothetical protein
MSDDQRVEAVARAIYAATASPGLVDCADEVDDTGNPRWHSCLPDARAAIAALDDARDAEIARLREALGGLHDALGLRRDDHELLRDYGELGLDWIKRARTALNGGDH